MMVRSIIVAVVGIASLLSLFAQVVPIFGSTSYDYSTTTASTVTTPKEQHQPHNIQSLHADMMISNHTAVQIVASSHLPGIENDTIARTIEFQYWKYNGTIQWANDTVPQYIIYIANPTTLAVNWTDTLPFIGNLGEHAFFMSKDDTSDKYVWVVVDAQDYNKYPGIGHKYVTSYYVDAFSGNMLAYNCACCGVCT